MRRTKAEAEQTRHDILKAALILFDEQGYVQTNLSDIARKAEVTRGAIYWHFDNKEQIVAALAQAQFDDLMRQNAAAISINTPNSSIQPETCPKLRSTKLDVNA